MSYPIYTTPGYIPGPFATPQTQTTQQFEGLLGNPLLHMGLGILGNNRGHYGAFGPAVAQGALQGIQGFQQQQFLKQRQKLFEGQYEQSQREINASKQRDDALERFNLKHPELADMARIDPKSAFKMAYPHIGDPMEYGLMPQKGINPQTGKPEMFVQDKSGATKWLGIAPPPDNQVFAPTDYRGPLVVNRQNPTQVTELPMPPQQGTGSAPVATGPKAPWGNITSPKQQDEAKQKAYEAGQKQLDELRGKIEQGDYVLGQLSRFGELNRNTGTGSLLDRSGLPSFSSDKREMEAIQARLAPNLRPPGSGTTSDKDIALYLQSLPGVDKDGTTNENIRMQFEKDYGKAKEKLSFYNAYLQEYGHLNGADEAFAKDYVVNHPEAKETKQASTAKTIVKTGKYGGRKVVKYSDGSIDYAD